MTPIASPLPDDIAALKKIIEQLQDENRFLREHFNLARRRQFAASSEKSADQLELIFNEAEAIEALAEITDDTCEAEAAEPSVIIEATETPNNPTADKKPGRKPLPASLPREQRLIDIAEEQKVCLCCQGALHCVGEERSEQLEYIPASIKVIETVRPKYTCRHCEKTAETTPFVIAPVPSSPIPKSMATASLLAQIICNKYQFGLPLYRQVMLFQQSGIDIDRRSMANWMIKCGAWFERITDALKVHLLQQIAIHADETPIKVIDEDREKSYMWVYCSGADSPNTHSALKNIALYDYQPSRAAACPKAFLQNYAGYLQVDGYAAYEQTQAKLVGCFAHARRKFIDAQSVQPKGKIGKADWALNHIQKLYAIEKQLADKTPAQRYALRQEKSTPLLAQFKSWLDKSSHEVPPKSAIGAAIFYCLNQWNKLAAYAQDGHVQIDNNRAERAIKPFVIGRKNWLFSATNRGARASAILYSVIETAKANGLEPLEYIHTLLDELPRRKADDSIEDLMPWAVVG
jgi:transposase